MKIRFPHALLVLAAACSPSPEALAVKAHEAFAAHDYTAARLHLAEALKERPDDRDLLLLQARTLIELGDGEGARGALDRLSGGKLMQGEQAELAANAALLRRAPDVAIGLLAGSTSVEASRLRAAAAMQQQDMERARIELDKAIAAGGSAHAYSDYVRLLLIKNDLAGAGAMQGKAEQLGADQLPTMLTGGELAIRQGDLASALVRLERADKAYPHNVAVMTNRATVLGDLGRFNEMDQVLQPLAAAQPQDPVVAYLQARLAKARKDWGKVKAVAQPLESKLDQQDPLRLLYAEALTHAGQAQQAVAQAAPIARANPGNREALRILAEAQLSAGDAKGALATYRPVASSPAARPEELALFAAIAKAAGDPQAVAAAQVSAAASPKSVMADLAEGDAAMRQGNWARAAIAYDRIMAATDGKNVLVLNNLAYARSMLADHARAIELADRAMGLAPANASVLDTAGWVRFKAGKDLARARELVAQAAGLAPANTTIRDHLAQIDRKPA